MAVIAGGFVDIFNRIAGVAVAAEGSRPDGGAMVVAMARRIGRQDFGLGIGEVIASVTAKAVLILGDDQYSWPICRILQGRRGGVTIAALIFMYCHRIVGRMTADTERGV